MQCYLVIEINRKDHSQALRISLLQLFFLFDILLHRLYVYILFNNIRNSEGAFVSSGVINKMKSYPLWHWVLLMTQNPYPNFISICWKLLQQNVENIQCYTDVGRRRAYSRFSNVEIVIIRSQSKSFRPSSNSRTKIVNGENKKFKLKNK